MKSKQSGRRLTAEQRAKKLQRRKERQSQQQYFEKELRLLNNAEKALIFSLPLLFALSFLMTFDRAFCGASSMLMLLVEIFHLFILHKFKTLWKKQFIPILCTYICSAAIIALFCTVQSAVFTPAPPIPWILLLWSILLSAWLSISLQKSENQLKNAAVSVLMALSLFIFCFFWIDRVNISFDHSRPQTVSADILDFNQEYTGHGGISSKIKVSFPLDDHSRITHRFHVLRTDDYKQLISQPQLTILRHEGALGAQWYEIEPPK